MSEKRMPGVMLYCDFWRNLKRLSTEEKGALVDAMMNYAETGEMPDFDGVVALAWDMAKDQVDKDVQRYAEKCERNRENVNKRWGKSNNTVVYDGINGIQPIPNTKPNTNTKSKSNRRFISTGDFEGYWEEERNGEWVRI